MPLYVFETDNLYLRHLQHWDEVILFPEIDEKLTEHWIGWEPPVDMKEQKRWITETIDFINQIEGCVYFLAFARNTNEFIGACGITPVKESTFHCSNDVEFDIWIKRSAQRNGYAFEIMSGLIKWAQCNTPFPYIIYSITGGNTGSEKLLNKLWGGEFVGSELLEKRGEMRRVFDYRISILNRPM